MTVPFMDLKREVAPLCDEILAALAHVVDSQAFILGPDVGLFENEFSQFIGCEHTIGVSSGSDALLMALMALGIGPGDEVIVPSFTFFATAGAVARLGATPVFADIDEDSFLVADTAVAAAITPRTRAFIPVHLYGRAYDPGPLAGELEARGIALIEDAAQAVGAALADGRRAGRLGRMGCFSFFPAKNLGAFGDGGAVTCMDATAAEHLRVLRLHGSKPKYHHQVVGGNFRLDTLQAAVLRVKLRHLDGVTAKRNEHAARYRQMFADSGLVARGDVRPPENGAGVHCYHQFVIRARDRDGLQRYLEARGIGTMVYYPVPLHLQACFRDLGYVAGSLPVTERAARDVLALPVFAALSATEQETVVGEIVRFYEGR